MTTQENKTTSANEPKFYVLNNCGHVSGAARQWSGYRHIALMFGRLQYRIQNTNSARIVDHATIYVGATDRSEGVRLLKEYEARAQAENYKLSV